MASSPAMDFYGQQERARTSTRRLVFLFIAALVLTNLAIYLAVSGAFRCVYWFNAVGMSGAWRQGWLTRLAYHFGSEGIWNWELLNWVTLLVTLVVTTVSGYKLSQLSRGGAVVAQLLGGRWLNPDSSDLDERKLLNVVEEMAIASGLPIPDLYLLEEESGINAFAAGNHPSDAVVGVTFGALKLLSRDEMQGMIAHEFSHILNGDMRLNTRLIGWLHGVLGLVVLGRILTLRFLSRHELGERGERVGPIFHPALIPAFVLGWICIAAGSLGAFAARLIKSSVNRQREYLADAAAVQFTRNPDGIAGALKKIGGLRGHSLIAAGRAEEASHLYFGDGMKPRWFRFLATHPPLTRRIQRLDPSFDGQYPPVSLERVLRASKVTALYREQGGGKPVDIAKLAAVIGPAAAAQEMLYAKAAQAERKPPAHRGRIPSPAIAGTLPIDLPATRVLLGTIPEALRVATQTTGGAMALVYAMVCGKEPEVRARQLATLTETLDPETLADLKQMLSTADGLNAGHFLPLADLAVRGLRRLSPEQFDLFQATLERLVAEDQQIDLFEYMLQRMIVRHLEPHFRLVKSPPTQYYTLQPLLPDCAVLLSGLARIGQADTSQAEAAFRQGAALLSAGPELRFLPLTECNLAQIDEALVRIAQATTPLKRCIRAALTAAAAADGRLQRREAELLRAFADAVGLSRPLD